MRRCVFFFQFEKGRVRFIRVFLLCVRNVEIANFASISRNENTQNNLNVLFLCNLIKQQIKLLYIHN